MSVVPIEAYNQMQSVAIISIIIAIVAPVIIGVFWVVKNMLRSKSGKVIDSVKTGHKQLLLAATPSHTANLFKVFPLVPGILQTTAFKNRVNKKRKVFYEAEKTKIALEVSDFARNDDLSEEQKKQRLAINQECLDFILAQNTDKVYLENSVPLTLAIEDKVITLGVKGIGAMAHIEKLYSVNRLLDKIRLLDKTQGFKDIANYLKYLASQITIIDIDLLRNYFNSDWDQSDDESQKDLYYNMGLRDGRQKEKGFEKWFVFGGIGIGIAGIIGGAVLAWLSKGG
jgi:hypothetical protein